MQVLVCLCLCFSIVSSFSLRMYLVNVLDDKHSQFKFLFGFLYFWFLPFCLFDVNDSWNQSKFYVTCCPFVLLSFYLSALMSVHRCIYCLFILFVCKVIQIAFFYSTVSLSCTVAYIQHMLSLFHSSTNPLSFFPLTFLLCTLCLCPDLFCLSECLNYFMYYYETYFYWNFFLSVCMWVAC